MKKMSLSLSLLCSMALISCCESNNNELPIEGVFTQNHYENERFGFSVDIPEGYTLVEFGQADGMTSSHKVHTYAWQVKYKKQSASLFVDEVISNYEDFDFSGIIDGLKKNPSVVSIDYEPWYKFLRHKINVNLNDQSGSCHMTEFIRFRNRLYYYYATDSEFSNPEMEEFFRHLDVKINYGDIITSSSQSEIFVGIFVFLCIILGLIFGSIRKKSTVLSIIGLMAGMAIVAGAMWFFTGIACTATYVFMGIAEAGYIITWSIVFVKGDL